jgi:ribose/xylose/arabinose/galactoside ABC-type transport system permease subunit
MTDIAEETDDAKNVSASDDNDERLAYRGVFASMLVRPEIGAIIGAAAIWLFFWAVAGQFGTTGGLSGVLDVSATLGIMAVAVALLMIGGEFDLSAGAATGARGIVTILLVKDVGELGGAGLSLFVAIPLSFVIAMALGWTNGTVVERTGLPSFIVTLATFFVLRGFKLGFSKLTIDNISVGRIDEGHGFDFWQPIFAGVWARNDHQWDTRDWVYTIGILLGLTLLALAVYEANYLRKKAMNPAGLGLFAGGAAGAVVGVALMHTTDGVGANTVAGLVIVASMVVGFGGLAVWRYQPVTRENSIHLDTRTLELIGLGLGLVVAGGICAKIFDVDEQASILDQTSGPVGWFLVLLAGAIVGGILFYRNGRTGSDTEKRTAMFQAVRAGFVGAFGMYAFMFMTTEQGLRAILFVGLATAGLVSLAVAASRAGKSSPMSRTVVLMVATAAFAGLALFIRSESASVKFRTELFSVMMFSAGALLAWALVSGQFKQRRTPDHDADRLSTLLGGLGIASMLIGLVSRLLWTTTAEIEGGVPPANFRMSIVWFIGVTAVATFLLGRTKFGSWIFAVGGNKQAARQVGVPAARTKTQLFMIVAGAAWLVGLLLAFRLQTLQSGTGNGLEFEYIIAAVVGGTALTGGYGSVLGAAIGAFIMAMSKQGIGLALWNSDWRFAFLGVILLGAVMANNFIKAKAESIR